MLSHGVCMESYPSKRDWFPYGFPKNKKAAFGGFVVVTIPIKAA